MEAIYQPETVGASSNTGRHFSPIGAWTPGNHDFFEGEGLVSALHDLQQPLYAVLSDGAVAFTAGGGAQLGTAPGRGEYPLLAYAPPCDPAGLGDASFCRDHRLAYPYIAGAMANGIGSVEVVEAMGRAGMLAFFGSAGLSVGEVEAAVDRLTLSMNGSPYGFNFIHSPSEPELETAVVELYLRRGIRLIEASAFLGLTLPLIRYRLHGIHRGADGRVVTPNRIIAKVSREEVAEKFFSPAPEKLVRELVTAGNISEEQAALAGEVPVAQDVTAEADSGGHTDHRPAIALLPTLQALRDRMQERYGYAESLRVGLGGGISTPQSAAAAFAMGAAYVLTGSVNQACVEAGTSDEVREMLADARQADVTRAPAADMFEMGVTLQVLKRGTMFAMRGARLYELYRTCKSLENIPAAEREKIEKTTFRASLDDVWEETRRFFAERDPGQIERAERDSRHKMALVFRWYLGQSSNWANRGIGDRKVDYQVWCGPAMGAFNEWVRGSFLELPANRSVATIALNILRGAAILHRVRSLEAAGNSLPAAVKRIRPLDAGDVRACLGRETA